MANKILLKRSSTAGVVPSAGSLDAGELALNTADMALYAKDSGGTVRPLGVPAGTVEAFARNTAPTGWLKANGAAVSRSSYAALFAAMGTAFGVGDGSTTFNLPDLRGEFVRGWDDSRGVDSGRAFGAAQSDALIAHTHIVGGNYGATAGGGGLVQSLAYGAINSQGQTPAGADETRPRNIALLYCIKY